MHREPAKKYPVMHTIVFVIWCCAVICIPFHKTLSSPLLILSFLAVLLSGDYKAKWKRLITPGKWMLFASIYLIAVYAMLGSENKELANKDLQVKLYLLLIPFFMYIMGPLPIKRQQLFLKIFVWSCLAFIAVALSIATYRLVTTGENKFYYKYLVDFTYIHPSYEAMFMVFAIGLIGYDLIQHWNQFNIKNRIFRLTAIAALALFILLLTAKIAIASMFLVLSVLFIVWGIKHLGKRITIIGVIVGNILLFLAMIALPYTRERMLMLLHYNEVKYTNSVDSREEIWRAAIDVSKQNLITGTGSGDAEEALVNQYAANGFTTGVEERYNAHNAWLQVLVESGWPGLILFLGFFLALLQQAWRHRNYVWLGFLILFMINITTESMFKTQSGVVFFAFFNALLGLHSSRSQA